MPKKYTQTEIDGQSLKLSNLDKVLYPNASIVKAEIIQYYLQISDKMLAFSSGRPLSLIRYPDGIQATHFYTRNKPDWTPDWIPTVELPWDKENTYLYLNERPSLIWLANLAALEIHIMGCRIEHDFKPDHFVIDLDPSPGFSFEALKSTALNIKSYLEKYDLVPFIKTSGSKGLHILTPVEISLDFDAQIQEIKTLLKAFIQKHKHTTLGIQKTARTGKVLLDIYRNHKGNTTVSPYSLRAKPGAPISVPFDWEHIDNIQTAKQFHIRNVDDWINLAPNWANFEKASRPFPTVKQQVSVSIPEVLKEYNQKRDFDQTKEPKATKDHSVNGQFVIQLHDASNLHYDLRLGMDGVLKSWAIPKGLPIEKDKKRLAIQTEDHPAKYLNFEGIIPEGEYGGGTMWIFDTGSFELVKSSKNKSYTFRLQGKIKQEQYTIFEFKPGQWLLTLDTDLSHKLPNVQSQHMLADQIKTVPSNDKYFYEVKWDGIRVFVIKHHEEVRILSRSGRDISKQFPKITNPELYKLESMILDGEIVCLDGNGKPQFKEIISRMHSTGQGLIQSLSQSKPASFYAFDLVYFDGYTLTNEAIEIRRSFIPAILKLNKYVRFSESFDDGEMLLQAIKLKSMEGIMAKKLGSKYSLNQRSRDWLKIKIRHRIECYIVGYTKGKGDRSALFGSLHLAELDESTWLYRGRVGTGFNMEKLKSIYQELMNIPKGKKPFTDKLDEEQHTTWIEPILKAHISYASMTDNQTLREPVFISLIEEKSNDQ